MVQLFVYEKKHTAPIVTQRIVDIRVSVEVQKSLSVLIVESGFKLIGLALSGLHVS